MNDSNIKSTEFNEYPDRMAALEKEVAALNQENQELKDLLRKLDIEEIYAHRIYKQVKEKLESDLENDNQQKLNNPLLTGVISILVAGVTALLGNTAFVETLKNQAKESATEAAKLTNQKIKADVEQVEQQLEQAQTKVTTVENKVKQVQTTANNVTQEVKQVQQTVNEEIKMVEKKVEQAQSTVEIVEKKIKQVESENLR